MKIEKIAYNKIKLTVTGEDMQRWGVDITSFAQYSPETAELFKTLIKRAEMETGMEIENSNILVEAMPYKSNGLLLFVTKIDGQTAQGKKMRVHAKAIEPLKDSREIFEFDDFEDICGYAENAECGEADGDLYFCDEKYYLILNSSEITGFFITEYGKHIRRGRITVPYIEEHGTLIAKGNAVKTVCRYFNKKGEN